MSIEFNDGVFNLSTENTSYLFRISEFGHLEHIHYGERVESEDAPLLCLKNNICIFSCKLRITEFKSKN